MERMVIKGKRKRVKCRTPIPPVRVEKDRTKYDRKEKHRFSAKNLWSENAEKAAKLFQRSL